MSERKSDKKLMKTDTLSVKYSEEGDILIILTKHGLIRVYPERKDKSCTLISVNADTDKLTHTKIEKHIQEDLLGIEVTGYTPDDDYWE